MADQRRTLLAVHAHPDDECLSTGGVLARYGTEGARTVLVTCTGGEVGEISDPSLATPGNLGEVRVRELAESVRILSISRSVQLGYRDSGMAGTDDNDNPASFQQADLEEATGRLVRVVREERPEVLLTYDANGGYGHPDHIRAHDVAVAAFSAAGDATRYPEAGEPWAPKKLYYTVFFPRTRMRFFADMLKSHGIPWPWGETPTDDVLESMGAPEEVVTTEIDVSTWVETKRNALLAHRTQIPPTWLFVSLPLEALRQLWAHEYFQRIEGPTATPAGERETDLFSGL